MFLPLTAGVSYSVVAAEVIPEPLALTLALIGLALSLPLRKRLGQRRALPA